MKGRGARIIILGVMALCLITFRTDASTKSPPPSFANLYDNTRNFTVYVTSADPNKAKAGDKRSVGSGFVTKLGNKYHVITVNHVGVKDTMYVKFDNNGDFKEITRSGFDTTFDLAVYEFKDKQFIPPASAILGNSDDLNIRNNETLRAMGHPLGLVFMFVEGKIMKDSVSVEPPLRSIALDMNCNPGNSGSPLIQESGKVVGILQAISDSKNPICFATPINTLKFLMPKLLLGEIKHGIMGLDLADTWTLTPPEKKELGFSDEIRGVIVTAIQPGYPTEIEGVRRGDVILDVIAKNGAALDNPILAEETAEFVELLNLNFFLGDKATVRFIRNGQIIIKTLALEKPPAKKTSLSK